MQLREYQQKLHDDIYDAWDAGANVVMAQLPTGGGKTVTFSHIVAEEDAPSIEIAHRQELICQMSVALAREGVRHRVFGPSMLSRLCSAAHMEELKRDFINPQAWRAVASVQTLAVWKGDHTYFKNVKLWVGDEGHHYLRENQFGKVTLLFPNARGLLVTATPGRADGKGLGRHADGLADVLVRGPSPAWMIKQGYLSRYKIYKPPSDFNRDALHVTPSGEFSATEVKVETRRSTVMGDIVEHYCRHAAGKLGLTFADSIENAVIICDKFRAAGVPAEVLTGKTPDMLRASVLRRFRNREVMQIVSVQLIDEGFDCPGVEVVSDGAATASLGRYLQRFGRALRVMVGKEYALYFDHVGNIKHGLPDAARRWSLDRRDRQERSKPTDVMPVKACPACTAIYERCEPVCPYCGHTPEPLGRKLPEQVDGDLILLDDETLERMRGDIEAIDELPDTSWMPDNSPIKSGAMGNYRKRRAAQRELRETISLWGGWRTAEGDSVRVMQRRFYLTYGVDVMTAQALGVPEARALRERILLTTPSIAGNLAATIVE
jgi:DNA repair protein RadD